MAGRKTFRTDIVIGGKVNPTLQKATTSVVRYVNQIRTAMLGTLGIASVSMAFNTVKKQLSDCVEKAKAQNEAEVKLKNALANNVQLRKLGQMKQVGFKKSGLSVMKLLLQVCNNLHHTSCQLLKL